MLIEGARQVGKTTVIEEFLKSESNSFAASNLIEDAEVLKAVDSAANAGELLLRLSAFSKKPLVPNKTVLFINEIQQAKDAFALVKYLVKDGRYRFVFSGSLLGVKMQSI